MPKKNYIIKDFSGGVNKYVASSQLEDNEAVSSINLRGDREGKLRTGTHPEALLSSSLTNGFTAGEGFFSKNTDYLTDRLNSIYPPNPNTSVQIDDQGTTITDTANPGELKYGAGGAGFASATVKFGASSSFDDFKAGQTYHFRMLILNINRNNESAWPGWLEAHISDDNPTTYAGSDPKYYMRNTDYIGPNGGIFIKANAHNATPAGYSQCTTSTKNYYVVADFVIKCPYYFHGNGSKGNLWLLGHPNGTLASGNNEWQVAGLSFKEVPCEVGATTKDEQLITDAPELVYVDKDLIVHTNANSSIGFGVTTMQYKNYANSDATGGPASTVSRSSNHNAFQVGQLTRHSNGNYADVKNSEPKILGPIVKDTNDGIGGIGSTITTNATSETIANDKFPFIKHEDLRQYYARAQDPNSIHRYPDKVQTNLGRTLVSMENTSNASRVDMAKLISQGQIGLSVTKPSVNGTTLKEDWKKKWKFGIAYKLQDNSYTNVQEGGSMCQTTENGTVIEYALLDPKYEASTTDGFSPNRTFTMNGGSSNPTNVGIFCSEGSITSTLVTSGNTAKNKEPFEIPAGQVPGRSTQTGTGFVYASRAYIDFELDLTDAAVWTENPRFELFFKEDIHEHFADVIPDITRATGTGIGYSFDDKDSWYHPIGGNTNGRDPRIDGFIVFMYSDDDLAVDEDVPWQPLFEVNLNTKEYKNWTYDQQWRKFEQTSEDASSMGHTFATYTTDEKFAHNGSYNCERVPDPTSFTYSDLIPYSSTEQTKVRWKASEVVNGRAVIGNTYQNNRQYGDRIIVSAPGTIDTFPESYSYDVGSGDGQSIVAMKSFNDKLLVFKEKTLYILNFTDPENFFIEADYEYYGVKNPGAVCSSDFGVSWLTEKRGVLHYDGEIKDLSTGKLSLDDLSYTIDDGWQPFHRPLLGFSPKTQSLLLVVDSYMNGTGAASGRSEAGWVYDFKTEDWWVMDQLIASGTNNTAISNLQNDKSGNILWVRTATPNNTSYPLPTAIQAVQKLDFQKVDGTSATRRGVYQTKELDFGDPGLSKHVYKVSLKWKRGGTSVNIAHGYKVKAVINGNYDDGDLKEFVSASSANILNGVDTNDDWLTKDMLPATPSEFKNIKTFALQIGHSTDSNQSPKFELDSISITYRVKAAT
ncbi:MAG: hypothetical protein Unbinned4409contig1002_31 [Prokaryotic dsDNA virus sp.]|nr:MAG: hypothetical protein Unbinned4409contig1002_31 [Prokaryotic dsDNA virus sp.]